MPNLIEITEFSAPELDVYARLSEVQLRSRQDPSQALFIAESPLVIGRALDAGCVPVSALMDGSHVSAAAREILTRLGADVPVFTAEDAVLTQLTGFHLTRGMLCAMRRPALPEAGALCRAARRVVVLENVMNPTNLGAIFRSAAALNMDAVLLTEAGSDPLYRRAVRVSMGTVFQIPWTYLPDGWPEPSMGWLRAQGFRTVAMALRDDSVPLNDPRLLAEERLAIVLGTEGDGLAQATIDACDYTVRIPMSHGVDSLNVAAASAVAFYQLGLQWPRIEKEVSMMQQYDKMILAILQGDDYHDAVHSLNEHGFYATVLNSSGGFLKKRSVTLMIGLESARLDEALAILKKHGERTEMRYEAPVLSPNMPPIPLSTAPLEIPTRCGGVVLFVLDVAQSARY